MTNIAAIAKTRYEENGFSNYEDRYSKFYSGEKDVAIKVRGVIVVFHPKEDK